ncbi:MULTISPECIES: adenine phosphoribosyltransferase [unclassified Roseiflexus]|jgi:adenine phosphoribosyltransferase|uniref:Adenine phosphoribosyltransferase n=1 Tax=Roseiflexus sp. (strain RS-1) TaxID=357808 RepID=APT_ROSS1|nr:MULTISPECIES: adenine phosphoribosyltransferase [unclassified Roseiflexus]A5URA4.1 RecName: Full=Adenine phosphoribosyltransferase; Short=APRT [Roseiflexus sp. RS-1]ABQ89157.1 adenine phosphoribosyltransferase [Roseiflexus sp. RS-1]MCL6542354.1 adenine phosphoribosyltransferase [Roseiflexus sp.]
MTTNLADLIRNIPDFPIPGIQFKDITPLLQNGAAFKEVIDTLAARYEGRALDAIVGIESRGFIFSAPLAYRLGVGMIPIRKPGKLPWETFAVEYDLEYGTNKLEMHRDALAPGARVVVIDDVLATGGTVAAACQMVEMAGAVVEEVAFLIELTFLKGRERLAKYPFFSMIQY